MTRIVSVWANATRRSSPSAVGIAGLRVVALVAVFVLAACAGRPGPEVLRAAAIAPVPEARLVTIYVATTRDRPIAGSNDFTAGRAMNLNYAAFTVSVPPGHLAGNIEWPQGAPDPRLHFTTVSERVLDRASFEREVTRRRVAGRKPGVHVFVHGFNNSLQEAAFRLVQIAADARQDDVPVLFAWPSEAKLSGYVADREAATFSRDRLVDLLAMLGSHPDLGRLSLTGHSMGGWLSAEALRQLRLTRQDAVLGRLRVVLAAPDIDVDVFRAQLAVIGPLSPPMTVLVSRDDVALSLSGFIAGKRARIGVLDVDDPRVQEAAQRYNVQVVDISRLESSDGLNHDRYSELAVLLPRLQAQAKVDADFHEAGAFVLDTVAATLSPAALITTTGARP